MASLNPIEGVINAGASAVEKVAGVFTTNAEKDAQRSADEQMALLKQYQAEYNQRANRNWVDSIADAFNRLVRPFIVTIIICIFIIAYIAPERFAIITLALSSIPDGYWALLSVIIAFYFGGRMQLKSQDFKFKESQARAIKTLIETKKEFRKLEMETDEPDKLVGDSLAKSDDINIERQALENEVAAKHRALVEANSDKSSADVDAILSASLKEEINNMTNESEGRTQSRIKSRRRVGPPGKGRH